MNLEKLTTNQVLQHLEGETAFMIRKDVFEDLLDKYAHKYYPNTEGVDNEVQRSIFKEGFLVAMNLFK